jgi:hypothetical protein
MVLFQVPAQLVGLDRPERGAEAEAAALHPPALPRGWLVDQAGARLRPARAALLDHDRLAQLQDQLFHRQGRDRLQGLQVLGQALAQGGQQGGQGGLQPARIQMDRHCQRLIFEPLAPAQPAPPQAAARGSPVAGSPPLSRRSFRPAAPGISRHPGELIVLGLTPPAPGGRTGWPFDSPQVTSTAWVRPTQTGRPRLPASGAAL